MDEMRKSEALAWLATSCGVPLTRKEVDMIQRLVKLIDKYKGETSIEDIHKCCVENSHAFPNDIK